MKILIVDDHPLFRAGFHTVLEQSALQAQVSSVGSLAEAIDVLSHDAEHGNEFGLVLLDLHLRDDDGFHLLEVIGKRFPTTACVMISGDEQEGLAHRAVAAGASGFIPKSLTAEQMVAAIQTVLDGGVFVPTDTPLAAPASDSLTLRQLEVISMLGRGLSNKQIAREMHVAERTVKAHVSAVFDALNVRNRTQAVLVAQQRGLLSPTQSSRGSSSSGGFKLESSGVSSAALRSRSVMTEH
jgi:DNA-binding NarL/FixJ family response regulator